MTDRNFGTYRRIMPVRSASARYSRNSRWSLISQLRRTFRWAAKSRDFGFLRVAQMRRRAESLLAELGFDLDPRKTVRDLSRAHQQMVEIAKALLSKVRLLILDEPTASLTERETQRLFALIERLRRENVGIIYVSHRMREIKQLADRITVLRDGKLVGSRKAADVTRERIARNDDRAQDRVAVPGDRAQASRKGAADYRTERRRRCRRR